jgi:hypothetical protein
VAQWFTAAITGTVFKSRLYRLLEKLDFRCQAPKGEFDFSSTYGIAKGDALIQKLEFFRQGVKPRPFKTESKPEFFRGLLRADCLAGSGT